LDTGPDPYDDCKLAIKTDPDGCLSCLNETGLKVNVAEDGCLECDSGLKVKVDPEGCLECGEDGLALQINPESTFLSCTEDGLTFLMPIGCGLDFDGSNTLFVDNTVLAGSGLIPEGVCGLAVGQGCGIIVNANNVSVNNATLAGDGLTTSGTCGLAVGEGCGITVSANAVSVDVADLAGDGLVADTYEGACKLDIDTNVTIKSIKECELVIEGGELKLKLIYDEVEVYGIVGAEDQEEICSVEVIECEET
jgi:hypothetical protein